MEAVLAKFFVFSSPSGAGKTSLVQALLVKFNYVIMPVSHTTRLKRRGEVDGENYHFVSESDFAKMVGNDLMLEHAKVFNNYYGVAKAELKCCLQEDDVFLEIDWQGMGKIKAVFDDVVSVFIMPPSLEILRQRLLLRNQDDLATINFRMLQAKNEIAHSAEYDHVVVNDDFNIALLELTKIINDAR